MDIAALVTWLVTAVLGFTMLATWVARGGARAGTDGTVTTRFAPGVVFGHFLLAVAGLVVWIIYLFAETGALAWIAFAALVVVAVLGATLFRRWLPARGSGSAESTFRTPVVYAHGLFAVATVVLVLLASLGIGADGS